ncbi:hypothetical protein I7819_10245 [Burkholderia multivorans]|uniref:hypothetical protein n=1 Tax=Burkholderia multivorans TaxID=87883 RepID=UPI00190472B3|nr:hypothetical protein [Burkholderia multivorans]MBJ9940262.1 hypothetical protein [Burkholderia multivorans]MBU9286198.1 hypothetical protein [Burkholderia multivorans]
MFIDPARTACLGRLSLIARKQAAAHRTPHGFRLVTLSLPFRFRHFDRQESVDVTGRFT